MQRFIRRVVSYVLLYVIIGTSWSAWSYHRYCPPDRHPRPTYYFNNGNVEPKETFELDDSNRTSCASALGIFWPVTMTWRVMLEVTSPENLSSLKLPTIKWEK